ncbi:hypothetical protein C8Q78DRAFT_591318 [Trametes maxima]|nr:hypothetical protein C8Q78DRAFT_591318 [Trametes maxima]
MHTAHGMSRSYLRSDTAPSFYIVHQHPHPSFLPSSAAKFLQPPPHLPQQVYHHIHTLNMYSSILAAPSPSMSCRSMSSNSSRSSFENAIAHSSNGYPSVLDPHTTRVRDCPGYDTRAATLNSDDTLLFFTEDDRRSGYAPEHLFANGAVYGESPSYHNPASLRGPHPIYATPHTSPSPRILLTRNLRPTPPVRISLRHDITVSSTPVLPWACLPHPLNTT